MRARGLFRPVPALLLVMAGCVTTTEDGAIVQQPEPNYGEAARINTQLGVDYMRRGQDELALEKLKRALEQDPDLADAHSAIAVFYSKTGESREAEKHYRRALSLAPDDPNIRNNFGAFLCTTGRPDEATRYFIEAARNRRYPSPAVAWLNAGLCAKRVPDLERAERYFREALKIDNDLPEALAQMARICLEQEDYLRARAFVQRYERVGRPSPEVLWIAARTEAALGDEIAAREYQSRLKKEFPESAESGLPIF